jgi:hypothetical protein
MVTGVMCHSWRVELWRGKPKCAFWVARCLIVGEAQHKAVLPEQSHRPISLRMLIPAAPYYGVQVMRRQDPIVARPRGPTSGPTVALARAGNWGFLQVNRWANRLRISCSNSQFTRHVAPIFRGQYHYLDTINSAWFNCGSQSNVSSQGFLLAILSLGRAVTPLPCPSHRYRGCGSVLPHGEGVTHWFR